MNGRCRGPVGMRYHRRYGRAGGADRYARVIRPRVRGAGLNRSQQQKVPDGNSETIGLE
jgi:hypothetical protein